MKNIVLNTDISKYDHGSAHKMLRKNLFPHDRWILPLSFALVFAPYIALPVLKRYFEVDYVNFLATSVFAGFVLLLYRIWRRKYIYLRELRDAAIRNGQTKVHLSSTEMHVVSTGSDHRFLWTHVSDVIDGKDGLLVLLSSCEYQPIPAASIPDDMTQESLRIQIKAWIDTASEIAHP